MSAEACGAAGSAVTEPGGAADEGSGAPGVAAPEPRSLQPTVAETIAAPSSKEARERTTDEPTHCGVGCTISWPQKGHGAHFT